MSEQAQRLEMWFSAWNVIKHRLFGDLHDDAAELVAALVAFADEQQPEEQ